MSEANMGGIDRVIRGAIGLGLLTFAALGHGPVRWLGLLGLIPLVTASLGTCPLYTVLGTSTCPVGRSK